jgi:hypothetical protein
MDLRQTQPAPTITANYLSKPARNGNPLRRQTGPLRRGN